MSPLLAMFGIGMNEMIIVMVIVLVLFGHRLPSVMRSMGRGIKEFKEGVNDSSDDDIDELEEKPKKKSQEDTVNH